MLRSIWIREQDKVLLELGFRPVTVAVPRKLKGSFAMACEYAVPEKDLDEIVSLLVECNVVYEVAP